jgi:hypothetical protein
MTIEDKIKVALARMIERKRGISDVVVTSWDEDFYPGDPEATCEYCGGGDSYDVTIYYVTPGERSRTFTYNGKFGDLIRELDTE